MNIKLKLPKIPSTGEFLEFKMPTTPEELIEFWRMVTEYRNAYQTILDQLKAYVPEIVDEKGIYGAGNYQFRVSQVQRMTYDKMTMREVLDPDLMDVLLVPDKPAVDRYLKENVDTTGETGTLLRKSMVPTGKPYQVIKLEKLLR